ncbi:MAG: DUF2339 domain-containing protein [Alphaproteobacteria bacterium]|nr:DUF2339 domain-containing protein [Alphaproteobacteria bacterium]MBU0805738.1 DUF2339 domain-containing protein [Alphaproteobacteria bacterium]MBU0872475.1 DUF2339 domain-containing protein [Alphaproteobacteria bacterium]MBU1402970.1 DUF2339 domain-containing protein [Alphaproteobacteria bacterium]MBU1593731.1 DUF2339 domain-containing protein [Alphaproteobacteria bacterium]
MVGGLIGFVVTLAMIVAIARLYGRTGRLEAELAALRATLAPHKPEPDTVSAAAGSVGATPGKTAAEAPSTPAPEPETLAEQPADAPEPEKTAGPWSIAAATAAAETDTVAERPATPKGEGLETALGTRWAVWVGGIALALGGLFLIRYSIEAGIFGPGVRLTMAALLGLVLVGAGEFVRRTGLRGPIEGKGGAYVPGVLTAAGAFTLFGTVYAAHAIYGFIGPLPAFILMGLVGVVTIAAALAHGQALAGLGLVGSMLTPLLVSSQSPSAWALFGYLAIVLAASTFIARLRNWTATASAGFAGAGTWCLLYMQDSYEISLSVIVFINVVILGCCALVWLARRPADDASGIDRATVSAAFFVALASAQLLVDPDLQLAGGALSAGLLLTAMVLIAAFSAPALPMLYAAGVAAMLVSLRAALVGTFTLWVAGEHVVLEGLPALPSAANLLSIETGLALVFLAVGIWQALRIIAVSPGRAASWSGWAAAVPLVTLASHWLALGNPERDLVHAFVALALTAALVGAGEMIARRELPPLAGGRAVSLALAGAAASVALMLHMGFGPLWTTMLAGAAAALAALATRWRSYPILGWIAGGFAIVVLARVAVDLTIVGPAMLGKTPVFNALLPGYGIPALAFAFAAWQLARTTAGRPREIMEVAATLFALLTVAMLVRHAMNGGVIDSSTPTLAELSLYTLIALGAGAILVALDTRSPSSVLRVGSMLAGVASAALIVAQHFVFLNPLLTNESTGGIPVFNLLFLAYLLPSVAAGGLAVYARNKRPQWYSGMLGLLAAALLFAYATLSVRRLFQGEHIGYWAGMSQLETYSYSALWLAMGVALLVAGVWSKSQVVRVASAVLIAVAVAKVFIFDMSELEGVLRALSFIGLGVVLIGIGLFYQKLLSRAARAA